MNIVIAEDEPFALEALTLPLGRFDDISIVGAARSGDEALDLILQHRPDLAILDIAMPRLTGLDVARTVAQSPSPPLFAFLTAYSDFALSAFELDALDYLLKPFNARRLQETIDRARRRLRGPVPDQSPPAASPETAEPDPYERELWIPTARGMKRLGTSEIVWIEAARDYVLLHTATRTDILRARMSDLERRLDPLELTRVHRSYFVRPAAITEVERSRRNQLVLVLESGARVEVGRSYVERLRDHLPLHRRRND